MYPKPRYPAIKRDISLSDLIPRIKGKLAAPKLKSEGHTYGYGIKKGDKILVQVSTMYDPLVVEAFVIAARELGAKVDVIILDAGLTGDLSETDEIDNPALSFLKDYPDRTDFEPPVPGGTLHRWAVNLAEERGYDMIVGGTGGMGKKSKIEVNGLTFGYREMVAGPYFDFPTELWEAIAEKSWKMIWEQGRGGRIEVTDPEGTNLTFTLHDKWFTDGIQRPVWSSKAHISHLMGHPPTPIIPEEDATGVIAGTISHTNAPFPHIKVFIEKGRVTTIEGGGAYGDAWRKYLEKTKDIQYPCFPDKGLFWLWEIAIGTNPKIFRLPNLFSKIVSGAHRERVKSGYIHVGIGTRASSPEEFWAAERSLPYGHLHVHLLFATYKIITAAGKELLVIDKGHLTSLDDPDIIKLAAKYGDPEELLREEWIPAIPGINAEGSYEDYAKDPFTWIKRNEPI
jgi:hypothetical protein